MRPGAVPSSLALLFIGTFAGCQASSTEPGASVDPVQDTAHVQADTGPLGPESDPPLEPVGDEMAEDPAPKTPPAPHAIKHARSIAPKTHPGLTTFAEENDLGGSLLIAPLAGNGDRDVVIFVPEQVQTDAPLELILHFHGTYSENIRPEDPQRKKRHWIGWRRLLQVMEAVDALAARRNVALVYPISAGKRLPPDHKGWSNKAYDTMWMHPAQAGEDFEALVGQARARLIDLGASEELLVKEVIAEGHSAGGIALWNVAQGQTEQVSEYIFLDAGFREWADGCWSEAQRSTDQPALVTQVITTDGMADPIGGRTPWCVSMQADLVALNDHRALCTQAKNTERVPPGLKKKQTCERLMESEQDWPRFEAWCGHMHEDARTLAGAYVHRTTLSHGDQPRHFSGGLELPPERLASRGRAAPAEGSKANTAHDKAR